MPRNKKKFISRKNAVTFQLVHRSQQDPLIVDDTAPQLVFKECPKKKNAEEERKYGIYYDDDYDYMQHLKNVGDFSTELEQINSKPNLKSKLKKNKESKLFLPSSVFESEIEESVGLLNKAAPTYGPRLEWDPDIVAAMDEDFDFDDPNNILEDNFVELANKSEFNESSEDSYEIESDKDFEDEVNFEVKSRFTDYSLTSSVMRRNEQLSILDDRFEKMFANYDDNEIGCLSMEDIEETSYIKDEHLIKLAGKEMRNEKDDDEVLKLKTLQAAQNQFFNDEPTNLIIFEKNPETWDCESILSTYSNIYNHPAKIIDLKTSSKIKINQKTGIPENVLNRSKLTPQALAILDNNRINSDSRSIISRISQLSVRPKNETIEMKKIRKQNIKDFRRERRIEKKANTLAFKDEKKRQDKIFLNQLNNKRKI